MKWEVPLGMIPERITQLAAFHGKPFGVPNGGGPLLTASGLVFIGAAMDDRIRAFDTETGAEIWSAMLPRSGIATPMSYVVGGKQYVVIAAGGHGKMDLPRRGFRGRRSHCRETGRRWSFRAQRGILSRWQAFDWVLSGTPDLH